MKLHTQTKEGVAGSFLFRHPVFLMDVRLELDFVEQTLLRANPRAATMTVATGTIGPLRTPIEVAFTLGALINGFEGIRFATLSRQMEFEESLRFGCVTARERLTRFAGVAGAAISDLEI